MTTLGCLRDGSGEGDKNPEACPVGGQSEGNPVNPLTGNKFQQEVDYQANALALVRYYNSSKVIPNSGFGRQWSHTYASRLYIDAVVTNIPTITVFRGRGRTYYFTHDGAGWVTDSDVQLSLIETAGGYELRDHTGRVEQYDADGKLLAIQNSDGGDLSLSYIAGKLSRVEHVSGRAIDFHWRSDGTIEKTTLPDGSETRYSYDNFGNLTAVTYPDDTPGVSFDNPVRQYLYEGWDSVLNVGNPHHLTVIKDELGQRFVTWVYDENDRVVFSSRANGAGQTEIEYHPDGTVSAVQPSGGTRTYHFEVRQGQKVVTRIDGIDCTQCGANTQLSTYDTAGNLETRTDRNGNVTQYANDVPRHLETARTEAWGTAEQRTIETDWHATFDLPVEVREPGRTTTYTYNSRGQELIRTETDTVTGATRTWTTTYYETALLMGLVHTTDGPRTDVSDVTTYAYYTDIAADGSHRPRDLHAVTNALGHITEYLAYDGAGRPLQVNNPNGVVTMLTYHPRGWLTSQTTAGETTTFDYDATGQLLRITQPHGGFIQYEYDQAHRLVALEDNAGNRIEHTLDAAGNRKAEKTYDEQGALRHELSRTYDLMGRLDNLIDSRGYATDYAYDDNGNTLSVTDPNNRITSFEYDPLDRLRKTLDAALGETQYTYDARDNLTAVTDPNGHSTQYDYNALGDLLQLDSHDTGVTTYGHDAAGNRTAQTDARGVVTHYSYDALNRLTEIAYPDDPALDVTYIYDQGANGLGQLTGMTDGSGSTSWSYDQHGRVTSKSQAVGGINLTVISSYDAAGRLESVQYPSGQTLTRIYDTADPDRVTALLWNGIPVLTDASYAPFGPVEAWNWGNGGTVIREHDLDGRPRDLTGTLNIALEYDAAGNPTAIFPWQPPPTGGGSDSDDGTSPPPSTAAPLQQYVYDDLDRLTEVQAGDGSLRRRWTYDPTHNRLSEEVPGTLGGTGDPGDQDQPSDPAGGTSIPKGVTYPKGSGLYICIPKGVRSLHLHFDAMTAYPKGRVESRLSPALPHQTVHAVFPHTAFRCSSRQGVRRFPTRCRGDLV